MHCGVCSSSTNQPWIMAIFSLFHSFWHFIVTLDCISLIGNDLLIRHKFSSWWAICLFLLLIDLCIFSFIRHLCQTFFIYIRLFSFTYWLIIFILYHVHQANMFSQILDFNILTILLMKTNFIIIHNFYMVLFYSCVIIVLTLCICLCASWCTRGSQ